MKESWTYKKLGEVCEVLDSKRKPVTKSKRISGIYPYYGATGIQDYVDKFIFDGNYLLVGEDGAKWGTSDKTAYQIHGKCWVNNHAHILKVNDDVANTSFLEYYLVWKDLRPFITGAIVQKLTQAALVSIPIPLPPLSIQSRIVSELDLLQAIIDKQKAQLAELDNLAQSIFYDMFGDPVENEKGWEVKKLGDCCNSELGKTLNQSKDTGTLRPYLCAINIQWNKIIKENLKQTQFEDTELERYSVKKGDLLICEGGDIGRAAIWNEDEEIQYQNALHRLRFGKEMIPIFCLYHMKYLKDKGVLDNRYGKGVTIKHLVKSALLSIPFILPPLSLQQSFASKTEAIERQKELINQSIREAQTLFDSRMEYYFGE